MKFFPGVKFSKGFTLMELLVALAIFGVAVLIVTNTFVLATRSQRKGAALQRVQSDARLIINTLADAARQGTVDYAAYSGGIANPVTTLALRDKDNNPMMYRQSDIVFSNTVCPSAQSTPCVEVSNDGGTTWSPLTSRDVVLSYLKFYISPLTDPFASGGPKAQPQVTTLMSLKGTSSAIEEQSPIFLQTTVSSRIYKASGGGAPPPPPPPPPPSPPVLTTIVVTPNPGAVNTGATLQFSAQGKDQFGANIAISPAPTWGATGGTINSSGLYTAGVTAGTFIVTATSGSVSGSAIVNVTTPPTSNITNVAVIHTPNHKDFTVTWLANASGSASCQVDVSGVNVGAAVPCSAQTAKLDLPSMDSWSRLAHLGVGAAVLLPWPDGGTQWGVAQTVKVKPTPGTPTLDGSVSHTFTCTPTSGSTSPTPNIDEDCNGVWDNSTFQFFHPVVYGTPNFPTRWDCAGALNATHWFGFATDENDCLNKCSTWVNSAANSSTNWGNCNWSPPGDTPYNQSCWLGNTSSCTGQHGKQWVPPSGFVYN